MTNFIFLDLLLTHNVSPVLPNPTLQESLILFFLQVLSFLMDFRNLENSVFITCAKFWPAGLLPEGVFIFLNPFLRVPSFLYFLQSPELWVVCAPQCSLHRIHIFVKGRAFFRMHSSFLKETLRFSQSFSSDLA